MQSFAYRLSCGSNHIDSNRFRFYGWKFRESAEELKGLPGRFNSGVDVVARGFNVVVG
jgi:hypothetical protein